MSEKEDKESEEIEEAPETAKGGKKKLIIIVVLALVLLGGGGAGLYFTGIIGSHAKAGGKAPHQAKQMASIKLPGPPVYYELPQIMVDLKTDKCTSPFLKTTIIIELSPTDQAKLEKAKIPFMERIQEFIREHHRIHLVGKAGSDRLKAGITIIANNFIAPSKIISVLFKEFLLQ